MCGITGYFSNKKELRIDINSLNEKIIHRGPDNSGEYYDEKFNLGFGHTRLSIVDLDKRANQPYQEEDIIITFNGEIYNFLELKETHLKGATLRTSSDTEVLVKLYAKYGIKKTLNLINGMFAFAIFDKKKNRLFLCRDRIGKKPIYYLQDNEKIVFASEAKCFEGITSFELNPDTINDTLYTRFSASYSPFSNIKFLENGAYLDVNLEKFFVNKVIYFKFEDLIDADLYRELDALSEEKVIDQLEQLLSKSIDLRMVSDVEIGSINSGGLDSSLVSAMALEKCKLKMFHIDVEGNSETEYAQVLAKSLKAELIVGELHDKDLSEHIDKVIYHYEYPLVHPNAFGIFLLSQLAKKNKIKVLLSGDGADEIFGGYSFYLKHYKVLKLPGLVRKISRNLHNLTSFSSIPEVYSKALSESRSRIQQIESKLVHVASKEERNMQAVLVSSLSEYLQPLNIRADKLGMANAVEFRSPFLDINVVRFAVNLPLRYKLSFRSGKIILKKLAERKIPNVLIYRKKMGFPVPLIEKANIEQGCGIHQNYVLYSADVLSRMGKKA